MKNKKQIILIIFLVFISIVTSGVYAIDTGDFVSIYNNQGNGDLITNIGSKVIGIIQVIGMSVAIITLTILGARYMYSAAASDKADIKSKLIPYVIGAVILFFASSGLNVIIEFVQDILK